MPVPEALLITSTTLSIAVKAVTAIQKTYSLVSGIKDAAKHIQRLSTDIQGLYQVLGLLQTVLIKDDTPSTRLLGRMRQDLESLLETCTKLSIDVLAIVGPLLGRDGTIKGGFFRSLNWELFKKNDLVNLQQSLAAYKLTINMAISSLNFVIRNSIQNDMQQLQRDVTQIRELQQRQSNAIEGQEDNSSKRAVCRFSIGSYNIPLQRFLEDTASLLDPESSSVRASTALSSQWDIHFDSAVSAEEPIGAIATNRQSWSSSANRPAPGLYETFPSTDSSNKTSYSNIELSRKLTSGNGVSISGGQDIAGRKRVRPVGMLLGFGDFQVPEPFTTNMPPSGAFGSVLTIEGSQRTSNRGGAHIGVMLKVPLPRNTVSSQKAKRSLPPIPHSDTSHPKLMCPVSNCTAIFTRRADVRRHLDMMHSGMVYRCLLRTCTSVCPTYCNCSIPSHHCEYTNPRGYKMKWHLEVVHDSVPLYWRESYYKHTTGLACESCNDVFAGRLAAARMCNHQALKVLS